MWLLVVLLLQSFEGKAMEIFDDHLKPTLNDGFDHKGLWIIGGGIAAVAIAQNFDYDHRENWSNYQRMDKSTARVGDFLGTGIPGSIVAIGQLIWDENSGLAHGEALIHTFIATTFLKVANQRQRPNSENRYAMPSGHTSTTFASATSLTYSYGLKAALPAYALASLTAASRWADDAHWLSDTIAGAFVGIFWGRATWLHHSHLVPVVDHNSVGVAWHSAY